MCLVLEWKTKLWAKTIDPWFSPFSWMTIFSPPPTHSLCQGRQGRLGWRERSSFVPRPWSSRVAGLVGGVPVLWPTVGATLPLLRPESELYTLLWSMTMQLWVVSSSTSSLVSHLAWKWSRRLTFDHFCPKPNLNTNIPLPRVCPGHRM